MWKHFVNLTLKIFRFFFVQEPQPGNRISCNSYFSSKHVIGPPIEEKYNVISGIHLNNSWCYTFLYVGNCSINKSKYKAVHLNNDSVLVGNPAGIYSFKVNNGNTWTMREICSMLIIKAPERSQWRRPGVFVNFEQILHIALLFQLLTLNKKILAGYSFDKIPFLEIVYAVDNQPQNVVTDNSCRKGN